MKKSFVVKKNGFEKFGDSLSDTEIEVRRSLQYGDPGEGDAGGGFRSVNQVNEKYATCIGDGFSIAPPRPKKSSPKAFEHQIRIKDEMKIDLRQPLSGSTSKQSSLYRLYPIEEVSERSCSSRRSRRSNSQERVQKFLEENRARAQNRPCETSRRLKMNKDFEIRKPFYTSEESELNSTFTEEKAGEVAKGISAAKNNKSNLNFSETTQSDSITSFKRAHIQRLSNDSVQVYQSRLLRYNEDCSNQVDRSSYTDDDLSTIRTYSTTKCNSCCFGKFFKNIRKSKK